jgi:hypothetical protein
MNQFKMVVFVLLVASLTACSGGGDKKVLIMASGKVTADGEKKNVKLDPGTSHNEQEITLPGADKETITVESPDGNKTYDLEGAGYFVLNLKPDTLVGGVVRYGSTGMATNLSNEQVDHIIDSTQKLMLGQNASDASKTYFIAPFTVKKVSDNSGSKVVGPYNGIPRSIEVDEDGNGPEMYKFFTNKQKRETLVDLQKQRGK